MEVRVQEDSFDPGLELNAFTKAQGNVGAVVSFSGIVRDTEEGLSEMLIEHYPGTVSYTHLTLPTIYSV